MKTHEEEIRDLMAGITSLCRDRLSISDYRKVSNTAAQVILSVKKAARKAAREDRLLEGRPRSEEMLFVQKIQTCGNMKRTLIERNVAWSFQPLVGKVVSNTYLAEKVKEAIVMAKRLKESHPHCDECFIHFVSPAFLKIGKHCEVVIHPVKAAREDRLLEGLPTECPYTHNEVAASEDKKKADCLRILEILETGSSMTPLDANRIGILRLGARIWDLRHDGYSISTTMVKVGRSRIASYRLIR